MRLAVWLAAPVVVGVLAAGLGSLPLFALALGLLVVLVGCAVVVRTAARRLRVLRTLDRHETVEGHPLSVSFAVSGVGGLPVQVEVEDPTGAWRPLPAGGGELPLVVDRPGGHVLEPARLRVRDDLGVFARHTRAGRPEALLVLPAPAPAAPAGRHRGHDPVGDPEPDGLRAYVPGTPMSRIHWSSVARGGDLQERAFVTTRDRLPLVVVDTAGAAGDGAVDWAARAAAGQVQVLARAGGCRVLLPGDRTPTTVADAAGWPAVHRRLADLDHDVATRVPPGEDDALRISASAAPPEATGDRPPLPLGLVPLPTWSAA
ncbi:DUF58 domain-containing protein [Patulibacter americanus]|uniref:DUF58 domain-containing protein n=1 Tax=Patulibacter americanus TaxID=588672 RepID=UPI00040DEDAE|nr:DUF58 domain-containing protein [Patulibacter americanus]